jgi:LysR family transcriptional activator of nhaA
MEWLNYHHLLYFWTVAREGTVARAAETLSLTQPTVSGQVRALEVALGEQLFTRSGRRLVLTEMGQLVFRYADEIFSLGRELLGAVKDRPTGRPMRLMVGVADALSKLIAYRVLEPATAVADRVHIVCREGRPDRLLAELSVHGLDLVLSDAPMPPASGIRAFNHLLGECGVTIFATARQARALRRRFPQSLQGAPFLLPTENTVLRRGLDQWLAAQGIRVSVSGEFDDSALMNVFGQAGAGAFAAPGIVEREVCRQYGVAVVGRIEAIRERCYAITMDRKIKHPAVAAVAETARTRLFEGRKPGPVAQRPDRT